MMATMILTLVIGAPLNPLFVLVNPVFTYTVAFLPAVVGIVLGLEAIAWKHRASIMALYGRLVAKSW